MARFDKNQPGTNQYLPVRDQSDHASQRKVSVENPPILSEHKEWFEQLEIGSASIEDRIEALGYLGLRVEFGESCVAQAILKALKQHRLRETSLKAQIALTKIIDGKTMLLFARSLWYASKANLLSLFRGVQTVEPSFSRGIGTGDEPLSECGGTPIDRSLQAHLVELPELLKRHRNWHVAYYGSERVSLKRTREAVEKQCRKRNLPFTDVLFRKVLPYHTEYVAF